MIEPYNFLLTIAVALSAFVAGWRAHRWHVLSMTRSPTKPSLRFDARLRHRASRR
jgi:hypothetical protein